MEDNK